MAQTKNVNMTPNDTLPRLHLSQYDVGRELSFSLCDGAVTYSVPTGATVKLMGTKPSGFGFVETCTVSGSTASISTTSDMTDEWGAVACELVVEKSGIRLGSTNLLLVIEKSPHPEGTTDGSQETVIPTLTLLVERVEAAASSVLDMEVVAETLPAGSDATYSYDEETNTATFGIPRGVDGTLASGVLASTYSTSATYAVGDYVFFSGSLYRCITAINTAEAWTSSHWTQVAVADDVATVRKDLADMGEYACVDLLPLFSTYVGRVHKEVTFAWNTDRSVMSVSGQATALAFCNMYSSTSALPRGVVAGETYLLTLTATHSGTNNAHFQIIFYANGSSIQTEEYTKDTYITVPSNADGMTVRFKVTNGFSVNSTFTNLRLIRGIPNKFFQNISQSKLTDGTDLDTIYGKNEAWFIHYPGSFVNLPTGFRAGVLFVYKIYGFTAQVLIAYSDSVMYKRFRQDSSGTWTEWQGITGSDDNVVINQNFNEYSSTNTYSVSPSITTDTNNYLAPTGDTTDVSGSILAMLQSTGICRLGAGNYWVSGVDMPENTSIIGSGAATKVYLLGTDATEGYAIKMDSRCTVKDLSVLGNTTDYTSNSSNYPSDAALVNRHGIIWQGNYSGAGTNIPRRGIISGCYVANFTGGGIACYDTGINVISGVNITDCIIWHCYAGIYIPIQSEFNRITSCMASHCHYGVINNGGNNSFANCNFSKNIVGFLIDNEYDQSPNNSHGSVVNCIFDHSDGNTGIGIKLLGVSYGETFSNCQLFYSQIYIKDCNGINISSLNAGWGNTVGGQHVGEIITIDGGSLVMFDDCVFRGMPDITVTNNNKVKFINCYTYDGTAVTP